jgi:hypothetical protein
MFPSSARFLEQANQPRVELFGPMGSFTVTYPRCNRDKLGEIRAYQAQLKSEAPAFFSHLDFDSRKGVCRLHIYPVSALPYAVLSRPRNYGY